MDTLSTLDTSVSTWRGRAVRYLLIYLALLVTLVSVRALTYDVRKNLRDAQFREGQLISQRDSLSLDVQSLESLQRVRNWAFANGMRRFAEATKVTQDIAPPRPPAASMLPPTSPRTVEVKIQWK
ncbi:hypothetical protein CVO96_14290 [Deinococcus koreensis]|uniref:Cell division protein FtsL n=1 Tax=Deinococcus koreensis TaxID=2054903 RepID=A0A2K3V2S1_9DEIO|nr:hypothetical protein CVO96_14290 [Deinococcus koreensis]